MCTPGAPQILDSAHFVVPARCHCTELRRRHDGQQPSRFIHNVFVCRKMSDDIDDHSKQKRSLHDGTGWPHDGLTRDRLGIRCQHERVISQYHRAIFWHAKDFSTAHDVADEAWQTKLKVIRWHKMPSRMARYCYDQNRILILFLFVCPSCLNIGIVWRLHQRDTDVILLG